MYTQEKPDLNFLAHYGKKGMKWGVITEEATIGGKPKSVQERNSDILKKNKYAAVVNLSSNPKQKKDLSPDEIAARNEKIKKVAIGVGIGLTVATAAVLYAKNKKAVDEHISDTLAKLSGKKISDLKKEMPIKSYAEMIGMTEADYNTYKSYGLRIDSQHDAVLNNFVANWLSCDVHRYDPISKEAYDSLDTKDITLKAGQVFHRLTTNGGETLRDGAYASFEADDVNRYRAFLPAMWKANGARSPSIYSMTMEAVDDIKSPSAKARVGIFKDLLDKDSLFAQACGYDNSTGSAQEFALKNYNKVATGLCDRNSLISRKYLETVKSLGYNALVDDNDAGRLAKTPMMLLSVSKSIKVNTVNELTKGDLRNAAESILPMGSESISSLGKLVTDSGPNSSGYIAYLQRFMQNMS